MTQQNVDPKFARAFIINLFDVGLKRWCAGHNPLAKEYFAKLRDSQWIYGAVRSNSIDSIQRYLSYRSVGHLPAYITRLGEASDHHCDGDPFYVAGIIEFIEDYYNFMTDEKAESTLNAGEKAFKFFIFGVIFRFTGFWSFNYLNKTHFEAMDRGISALLIRCFMEEYL